MRPIIALCCCFCLSPLLLAADDPEARTGPVVEGYGPVYSVGEDAFALAENRSYRVSKDLSTTAASADELNRGIDSVARFLNMQARAGPAPDSLEVALVVHGAAAKDLLTDAAYRERFKVDNPNTGLIAGLARAGVKIYICGQTAVHRGFHREDLNPAVTMALSAMSAHVRLQSDGYTLIPF